MHPAETHTSPDERSPHNSLEGQIWFCDTFEQLRSRCREIVRLRFRTSLWTFVVLGFTSVASDLAAQFQSDKFSGTTIDSSKWENPLLTGNGALTPNNGLCYYNNNLGTTDDEANLYSKGFGSVTNDWSAFFDAQIPNLSQINSDGQRATLTLKVGNSVNESNRFDIEMHVQQLARFGKLRSVGADLTTDHWLTSSDSSVLLDLAAQPVISMAVSWQATTKTFSAFYAPSGGGTNWIILHSWNLGPGSPTAWDLDPAQGFSLFLGGRSSNLNLQTNDHVRINCFIATNATIAGRVPPTITTGARATGGNFYPLPEATLNSTYGLPLQATNGALPYAWSLVLLNLPPGLNLATDGTISGTPTAAGTWDFRVRVAGADGAYSENNYSITVANPTNSAPPFAWAKRVANTINPDFELAIGLAIDGAANLFVTGWFDGTNDFGNGVILTNTPGGGQDMFVAKYNSAGTALWARQGGGDAGDWDAGRGIGVDSAGNVYVIGQFYGDGDFDGLPLIGSNNAQFFLAKYDNDGAIQWVRQSTGDWTHYGSGLAVDGAGNCYAVGYLDDGFFDIYPTITFDENTSLTNTNEGYGIFLVKYDSDGNVQWAKFIGSPEQCYSTSVAVDRGGNVFVSGAFHVALIIGNTNLTSAGDENGFLARFSGQGDFQWVRQMTTVVGGDPSGAAADRFGNVYVAAGFGINAGDTICFGSPICLTNIGGGFPEVGIGDAFLVKYDGSTGNALLARRAGGTNADTYTGVGTDSHGNVYASGGSGGIAIPDGFTGFGAVVAKYDGNGLVQWTQSSTGTNMAIAFASPVVDTAGNCYVAGWFQTNAVFGATTLTGRGHWDFFLAKIGNATLPLTLGIQWNDPQPQLSVIGEIGTRFVLEYAPTLPLTAGWQPLLTNTLSSSPFIHLDESAEEVSLRFYRARVEP